MTKEQYFKNLTVPKCKIDVILDTDTFNEVDDQFAISYMLASNDKLNIKAICAAPFLNSKSVSAADGMEKSYNEIINLLNLAGRKELINIVYSGSKHFLKSENTPENSPAAEIIAKLANSYNPDNPLYIVAIGAITNVAAAMLINPKVAENCVIVWLGGHAHNYPKGASEFNMQEDIAAARIVLNSSAPFIQLPCCGVVDSFQTSRFELEYWLKGKNTLCDYLYNTVVNEVNCPDNLRAWTRVIWDVTAIGWLLNDNNRFMKSYLVPAPIPQYDFEYAFNPTRKLIQYVYSVNRDSLFTDLFKKLQSF